MNSSYLLINGIRIHYLYWNRNGNGAPIIFHHGLASNARIWEMTAPLLAKMGYALYALDARGHGLSDKPDEGYDIETITSDLAAFIRACNLEHPLLVGHSWGGFILLNYAARFASGPYSPCGIVLVDGGVSQLSEALPDWEEARRMLTPPPLAGMPLNEFITRLRQWNSHWNPSEQAISIMLANFEIDEEDRIYPRLKLESHMQIVRSIWDFPTFEYYPKVHCPALFIPAKPPEPMTDMDQGYLQAKERGVAQAQATMHHLTVRWMDDAIHDIPLQRPDQLAQMIADFAAQVGV